ncbi:unnamed protein product, partial [Ectocarpus fasciculatus]
DHALRPLALLLATMFRSRMDHGGWTADDWRTKQAKHRAYSASRKSAVASVLHRRAMAANASAHGLPAPFELRGVLRRTVTGHHALPLHRGSMPFPPHVAGGHRTALGATQGFESTGIRRRGATGGAGESG